MSSGFGCKRQPPDMGVAANILNELLQTTDEGWYSSLGVVQGVTTPHCKTLACYKMLHRALDLDRSFGMAKAVENGYEFWNMECSESL